MQRKLQVAPCACSCALNMAFLKIAAVNHFNEMCRKQQKFSWSWCCMATCAGLILCVRAVIFCIYMPCSCLYSFVSPCVNVLVCAIVLLCDGCLPKHFRGKKMIKKRAEKENQITFQSGSTKQAKRSDELASPKIDRTDRTAPFLSLVMKRECSQWELSPELPLTHGSIGRVLIFSRVALWWVSGQSISREGKWMSTLSQGGLKEFHSLQKRSFGETLWRA